MHCAQQRQSGGPGGPIAMAVDQAVTNAAFPAPQLGSASGPLPTCKLPSAVIADVTANVSCESVRTHSQTPGLQCSLTDQTTTNGSQTAQRLPQPCAKAKLCKTIIARCDTMEALCHTMKAQKAMAGQEAAARTGGCDSHLAKRMQQSHQVHKIRRT
jgi:hypothetical protein